MKCVCVRIGVRAWSGYIMLLCACSGYSFSGVPELSCAPWIHGVPHVTMSSRVMNWSCCPFPLGIGSQSSTHRGKRRCAAAIRIEEGSRISRIFIWILCCEMPVTLRMPWSESPELVETGHIQPTFYGSAWQQHCDCWGSCRQFCCETFALQSTSLLQLGSRGHLTLWVLHSGRWYQVPAAGWQSAVKWRAVAFQWNCSKL